MTDDGLADVVRLDDYRPAPPARPPLTAAEAAAVTAKLSELADICDSVGDRCGSALADIFRKAITEQETRP